MKRYLIGFGNYAQCDDGVGLRVIERIVEDGLDCGFDAIELRNDGMALLTYFNEETSSILIVDCARMGIAPGDYRIFSPADVSSRKFVSGISTHEGDVLKLIDLARRLQIPVPLLEIMAIEPASLAPEMDLTPVLEERMPEYVAKAVEAILNMPVVSNA